MAMRVAGETVSLAIYRNTEIDVVGGGRGDSSAPAFAGPILRNLDPRSRDSILHLLRESGQSGCHQPDVNTTDSGESDIPSNPASPAVQWMAGAYFAEHLTGFVQARASPSDGLTDATLFVGMNWCRRGVGTLLLKAAIDWASCRRARTLRFVCARDDWPMRHFAKKFGARLDLVLGQIVADIPLAERIGKHQCAPSNC
jgi:Acetyltransferase (GNAT) family